MTPEKLKLVLGSGLLSFPVTHFDDDGNPPPLDSFLDKENRWEIGRDESPSPGPAPSAS